MEKKISLSLREKLNETLEYNFDKNCFAWADNIYIFKDLPINLRYDIMKNIHSGVFGDMQLF
jgi:hyperpolarization activated cyclic nucleotide-gated potassium channel 1